MTDTSKIAIWPGPFTAALILSPLLTALLGSSLFFISPIFPLAAMFSIFFGGPIYLVFGGPALYYWLRAGHHNPFSAALLALCVNAAVCIIGGQIARLTSTSLNDFSNEPTLGFLLWGSVFAPIWSAGFSLLYNYFTRHHR